MKNTQHSKQIESLNIKIADNISDSNLYYQRSQSSILQGDIDYAIVDLSKSICLKPTFSAYVNRASLFASQRMFTNSINDYDSALSLYYEGYNKQTVLQKRTKKKNKQKQIDNADKKTLIDQNSDLQYKEQKMQTMKFVNNQFCMNNIKQLKKSAQFFERTQKYMVKQQSNKYCELMEKILLANQKLQNNFLRYQEQAQQRLKQNELRYQQLNELLKLREEQFEKLENKLQMKQEGSILIYKNYESIFYKQIEQSTISISNKEKCQIYYRSVVSQMEKYYLAAKVLGDFEGSSKIKFEDYQLTNIESEISSQKNEMNDPKNKYYISKQLLAKLLKVFDRNSSKIDKISEVVKQLPYIGTTFKIIKSAVKGFGWFESIKTESQCQNILSIRSNTTSFNQFSMQLAYYLYKHNKMKITMTNTDVYQYSLMDKVNQKYKLFRKATIGPKLFTNVAHEDMAYIKKVADVHVAIFMMGIAYGIFVVPPGKFFSEEKFDEIAQIIDTIEARLIVLEQLQNSDEDDDGKDQILISVHQTDQMVKQLKSSYEKSNEQKQKSRCNIF